MDGSGEEEGGLKTGFLARVIGYMVVPFAEVEKIGLGEEKVR